MSKVHCGSAFEPGASGLLYYCTPPVCVPDVLGVLAVWWQNNRKKKSGRRRPGSVDSKPKKNNGWLGVGRDVAVDLSISCTELCFYTQKDASRAGASRGICLKTNRQLPFLLNAFFYHTITLVPEIRRKRRICWYCHTKFSEEAWIVFLSHHIQFSRDIISTFRRIKWTGWRETNCRGPCTKSGVRAWCIGISIVNRFVSGSI